MKTPVYKSSWLKNKLFWAWSQGFERETPPNPCRRHRSNFLSEGGGQHERLPSHLHQTLSRLHYLLNTQSAAQKVRRSERDTYLWGCRGRGGVANRRGWIPAPWSPCHDFLCDIPATLIGVADTDLGGQRSKQTPFAWTLWMVPTSVLHLHAVGSAAHVQTSANSWFVPSVAKTAIALLRRR